MATELLYGLLPDHVILVFIGVLMALEMFRVEQRGARTAFVTGVVLSLAALMHQILGGYNAQIIVGELAIDRLTVLGKLVLLLCALVLGLGFQRQDGYKFWLLAASALLGGMVILDSAGFITLFIGIELLSLPAFAAMLYGRGASTASEGAFKYLVMSSLATALVLFGISLAYGATGSLVIATWAKMLPQSGALAMASVLLVLCGLFVKAAVFPFHAWAPDAYASARMPSMALMASLVKAAVVLALVRVVVWIPLAGSTVALVMGLAIVSIYFGNIAALAQRQFKRMLAYSSVAHAGYMIFALVDTTGYRIDDLLWYSAFYAIATLLACAAADVISPDNDDLRSFDGKFAAHPFAAIVLAGSVLSLAGMPPLPGFIAKLFVFKSVVASGYLAPAAIAFFGSFLGLAFYMGIVMRMFRTETQLGMPGSAEADAVAR